MREAYALTGYVPDDVAKKLQARTPGNVEVSPERGIHEVFMQVDGADVTDVRIGAASGGVWKRSLAAGSAFSPKSDYAESLSIGALAEDPNPEGDG